MLVKYLIIVVMGFFGAGIIIIFEVFCKMFNMMSIKFVWVEGDSFYCFICLEMDVEICKVCE